jgi:penicillin-binding protein 1A
MELTSAYAAIAAGRYPVKPHAIPVPEPGFFGRLFGPTRRLGSSTQRAMLELLSAPIKQGTGTAARLGIDAYGKTGTSQDNRDALFIGFADDLVVGVWVGNDDNKPLGGINGGNVPARIWRDFMSQAIRGAAPAKPQRRQAEPEDLRDLEIPSMDLGNGSVTLGNDSSISLDTDIGGVGVNMKLDRDGVSFDARPNQERKPEPAPSNGPN